MSVTSRKLTRDFAWFSRSRRPVPRLDVESSVTDGPARGRRAQRPGPTAGVAGRLTDRELLGTCRRLRATSGRPADLPDPVLAATRATLRRLARRIGGLTEEIRDLDTDFTLWSPPPHPG